MKMRRPLDAYEYLKQEDPEDNHEINLYCILSYYTEDATTWKTLYEAAVADGVKPRDFLRERYEKL